MKERKREKGADQICLCNWNQDGCCGRRRESYRKERERESGNELKKYKNSCGFCNFPSHFSACRSLLISPPLFPSISSVLILSPLLSFRNIRVGSEMKCEGEFLEGRSFRGLVFMPAGAFTTNSHRVQHASVYPWETLTIHAQAGVVSALISDEHGRLIWRTAADVRESQASSDPHSTLLLARS